MQILIIYTLKLYYSNPRDVGEALGSCLRNSAMVSAHRAALESAEVAEVGEAGTVSGALNAVVLGMCDGLEVLDAIVVALAIQVINNHFLVGVVGFKFSDGGAIVRFEDADVDKEKLAIALEDHVARTVALGAAKGDVDSTSIFDTPHVGDLLLLP